eukprot:TRINITY_DN23471_c0_g1_i1.p1 TRINITY_DN23471_c0_g1~~TRINITY_DN23471_c0_g1_i1.p1  ORF type:complete len:267 (-),score=50.56 TRINITY_DN23471_c0_g1_i1:51-851(-)
MATQTRRVVCFHPFRSSADIFEAQLMRISFVVHFQDMAEFVFFNAPYQCTEEEEEAHVLATNARYIGPYFEWFREVENDEGKVTFKRFGESVQHAVEFMKEHGPFDGVLGFGQGGTFCHALLLMQHHGLHKDLAEMPRLNFCILLSAERCRDPDLQMLYKGAPFKIPSVFFWNTDDPIIKAKDTEELIAVFKEPMLYDREWSIHTVPQMDSCMVKEIRDWIRALPTGRGKVVSKTLVLALAVAIGMLYLLLLYAGYSKNQRLVSKQ